MTERETNNAPNGARMRGREVIGRDGDRIGVIRELLTGPGSPEANFAVIDTGGWLSHPKFAVPLALLKSQGGKVHIPVTRRRFNGAPEWHEGDMDFQRFHHYWQPPVSGGSDTISDAEVLIGEQATGTTYSGTELDTPAQRAANTLRAAEGARQTRG